MLQEISFKLLSTFTPKLVTASILRTAVSVMDACSSSLGNSSAAEAEIAAAQVHFKELGDQLGVATCLMLLGNFRLEEGNFEDAVRNYRAAREQFSACGDRFGLAKSAHGLARAHLDLSQKSDALAQFKVARELYMQLGLQERVENCDEEIELLVSSWQN